MNFSCRDPTTRHSRPRGKPHANHTHVNARLEAECELRVEAQALPTLNPCGAGIAVDQIGHAVSDNAPSWKAVRRLRLSHDLIRRSEPQVTGILTRRLLQPVGNPWRSEDPKDGKDSADQERSDQLVKCPARPYRLFRVACGRLARRPSLTLSSHMIRADRSDCRGAPPAGWRPLFPTSSTSTEDGMQLPESSD